jgi:hypothetical protein
MTYNAYNPGNDTLRLAMRESINQPATCNGDSGGPIFFLDESLGLIQMSMVAGGDVPCRATNTGPAFGLQEALDFVACGSVSGNAADVQECVDGIFNN